MEAKFLWHNKRNEIGLKDYRINECFCFQNDIVEKEVLYGYKNNDVMYD